MSADIATTYEYSVYHREFISGFWIINYTFGVFCAVKHKKQADYPVAAVLEAMSPDCGWYHFTDYGIICIQMVKTVAKHARYAFSHILCPAVKDKEYAHIMYKSSLHTFVRTPKYIIT